MQIYAACLTSAFLYWKFDLACWDWQWSFLMEALSPGATKEQQRRFDESNTES